MVGSSRPGAPGTAPMGSSTRGPSPRSETPRRGSTRRSPTWPAVCISIPPGPASTFERSRTDWATSRVHRASTRAQVEGHLRRHVLPVFGERPIGSIRTSEIQMWVKSRTEVLAPATVRVVFSFVSSIFASAVTDRFIAASPCAGISLPKRQPKRVVPLSTEEIAALIDALPDRYRALVLLASATGLRQGEAFGVTLDRVDFLRRTLVVDRQLVTLAKQPPVLGPRRPRPASGPCRCPRPWSRCSPGTWSTTRSARAACSSAPRPGSRCDARASAACGDQRRPRPGSAPR